MTIFALTTFDNPWDPIDDFSEWLRFDIAHGYGTTSYLARVAHTSDAFTKKENEEEKERAIDEIIALDFRNLYKKVSKVVDDDDKEDENEL